MKLLNKVLVFIFLLVFYVISSGAVTELTLVSGVVVSLAVTLALGRAIIGRELTAKDFLRVLYLLEYTYFFTLHEVRSHLTMVKLILSKRPRINPQVVKLYIRPRSDYGIALLASSITNTPGTLTVHVDQTRGVAYVHWIAATSRDPSVVEREVAGKLNELVAKVFR